MKYQCSDNIIYYVRPDEIFFGSEHIEQEWDNPKLLKGRSLHEVLRQIYTAGIILTTEINLMTNGGPRNRNVRCRSQ